MLGAIVAIETPREGDLVIARNEDTGLSGTFPVTALMTRVALDTYWVALARADGTTTRLGVTSEHPMFVVGQGWTPAGEVGAGDKIRDAALGELLVLSAELDSTPRRVHNLEVADAHTYFAGELEAWGHNARRRIGPDNTAWGPHSVMKFLPCKGGGHRLTQFATYRRNFNSRKPQKFVEYKRVDLDPDSSPHYDKGSQCWISPPHQTKSGKTTPYKR